MINKINPTFVNTITKNNVEEPKTKDEKLLMEKSEEFESLLLKIMLDSMDGTVKRENDLFHGGQAEEVFRDMLNTERATEMSRTNSFGLAEQIYNQLSKSIEDK